MKHVGPWFISFNILEILHGIRIKKEGKSKKIWKQVGVLGLFLTWITSQKLKSPKNWLFRRHSFINPIPTKGGGR